MLSYSSISSWLSWLLVKVIPLNVFMTSFVVTASGTVYMLTYNNTYVPSEMETHSSLSFS